MLPLAVVLIQICFHGDLNNPLVLPGFLFWEFVELAKNQTILRVAMNLLMVNVDLHLRV